MTVLVLLALAISPALSAPYADRIHSLPGVPFFKTLGYKQYSGYLEADDYGRLQQHYWFVESQNSPSEDPLVVWLNGGPGCSSLDGLLYEHGPLLVSGNGQNLARNPWSWNNRANVLYLEAPACVGFSYAFDGNCATNDEEAANGNFKALVNFFEKFPEFLSNELYITGESYAGVYVPTLSVKVWEKRNYTGMNLKGIAVGNALLSNANITNTLVTFSYAHGLFSQELYQDILRTCCSVETPFCNFDAGAEKSEVCKENLFAALALVTDLDLNIYDVTGPCEFGGNFTDGDLTREKVTRSLIMDALPEYFGGTIDYVPIVPCVSALGATIYLNNPDTREALHIPSFVDEWRICYQDYPYTKQYHNMHDQFLALLEGGVRALVYSGDVDGACNFMGGQYFVNELGYQSSTDYQPWKIGRQIAGYQQSFGDSLQFMTVRGAGHMVPQWKPRAALEMIERFLLNKYY